MIDFYTWPTPNGRKISIALEETALPYTLHPIDLLQGEQFALEFAKISPNNKFPAAFDRDAGLSIFETSAILVYLAEKSGRFLPSKQPDRSRVLEWTAWQMAGLGPTPGHLHFFVNRAASDAPEAVARFSEEAVKLLGVLEEQLDGQEFVAGEYSIADMAIFPWSLAATGPIKKLTDTSFPRIQAWHTAVKRRPGVIASMA